MPFLTTGVAVTTRATGWVLVATRPVCWTRLPRTPGGRDDRCGAHVGHSDGSQSARRLGERRSGRDDVVNDDDGCVTRLSCALHRAIQIDKTLYRVERRLVTRLSTKSQHTIELNRFTRAPDHVHGHTHDATPRIFASMSTRCARRWNRNNAERRQWRLAASLTRSGNRLRQRAREMAGHISSAPLLPCGDRRARRSGVRGDDPRPWPHRRSRRRRMQPRGSEQGRLALSAECASRPTAARTARGSAKGHDVPDPCAHGGPRAVRDGCGDLRPGAGGRGIHRPLMSPRRPTPARRQTIVDNPRATCLCTHWEVGSSHARRTIEAS